MSSLSSSPETVKSSKTAHPLSRITAENKQKYATLLTAATRGVVSVDYHPKDFFEGHSDSEGHVFSCSIDWDDNDDVACRLKITFDLDDRDGPLGELIDEKIDELVHAFSVLTLDCHDHLCRADTKALAKFSEGGAA